MRKGEGGRGRGREEGGRVGAGVERSSDVLINKDALGV